MVTGSWPSVKIYLSNIWEFNICQNLSLSKFALCGICSSNFVCTGNAKIAYGNVMKNVNL